MLTNFDLEDLCEKYDIPLHGVFMKDQLPKTIKDGNYIINLQSSNGGKNTGTHWTALIVSGSNAFFYDSFGASPSVEIRRFVQKRKNCHLGFNNWIVQDIHSENCGRFCLDVLMHVNPKHLYESANDYLNMFGDDTKNSDKIIMKSFSY